jgi:glycerol-3-phosphate O-acyltransferase
MVGDLPEEAVVVYVGKHKSLLEYLCYYILFDGSGLPRPRIGFDYRLRSWLPLRFLAVRRWRSLRHFLRHWRLPDPYEDGTFEDLLAEGCPAFLSLVEKHDFYRRFVKSGTDPLRFLLDLQERLQRPIVLVPLLLFFGKKPSSSDPSLGELLFGSAQKPGGLRKLFTLLRGSDRMFIEASDPVDLSTFLQSEEARGRESGYKALLLRRNLLRLINGHRRSITGPVLKSVDELRQTILTSRRLQEYMAAYARRRELARNRVHKEALGYLDEIAARYNPSVITIGLKVTRWMLGTLFDGVDINLEALDRVKRQAHKGPLILIPCHKSHMDSVVLSYVMHLKDLAHPHIFAGKNLAFWPMAPIFRGAGAFFVRRSFSGAVFYTKVFSEYIFRLLSEGFNILVYIEGTRSRSGKLFTPQLGMLSLLLNAYRQGACQDLSIVPIFIGYDRIPEEGAYINELEGGAKEPESFRQMLRARKFFKRRYGKIYLRFSEPLSLETMAAEMETGATVAELNSKQVNQLCREIGSRTMAAIDRATVVTPQALVAAALLNGAKSVVRQDEIALRFDTYLAYLEARGIELADNLLRDPRRACDNALALYMNRKFITPLEKGRSVDDRRAAWRISDNGRLALEYYKNNAVAPFISAAFTAMAILDKDAFQFSASDLHTGYQYLQEMFINEFAVDAEHPPPYLVRKTVKTFIDDAILVPHQTLPDTYHLTAEGFRKLKLLALFLKPFLESYHIVLTYYKRYPGGAHESKKRMKKIDALGNRMFKSGEVELREALSVINYANAIDFFTRSKVRGSEDMERIVFFEESIERLCSRL